MVGQTFGKRIARQQGVGQVIGLNALAKHFAVGRDPAHGKTAEIHAVVAFFAANEAGFGSLSLESPIRACHFEGRVR